MEAPPFALPPEQPALTRNTSFGQYNHKQRSVSWNLGSPVTTGVLEKTIPHSSFDDHSQEYVLEGRSCKEFPKVLQVHKYLEIREVNVVYSINSSGNATLNPKASRSPSTHARTARASLCMRLRYQTQRTTASGLPSSSIVFKVPFCAFPSVPQMLNRDMIYLEFQP